MGGSRIIGNVRTVLWRGDGPWPISCLVEVGVSSGVWPTTAVVESTEDGGWRDWEWVTLDVAIGGRGCMGEIHEFIAHVSSLG